MRRLVHRPADDPRAHRIVLHPHDRDLTVCQTRGQSYRFDALRGEAGPVAPTGDATGEDPHVVGEVHHRTGTRDQVVERARWTERSDHIPLDVFVHADRGDVGPTVRIERGDDALADQCSLRGRALRMACDSVVPGAVWLSRSTA